MKFHPRSPIFLGPGTWSLDDVLGVVVDPLWFAVVAGLFDGRNPRPKAWSAHV
jgi:hypothetical protein